MHLKFSFKYRLQALSIPFSIISCENFGIISQNLSLKNKENLYFDIYFNKQKHF